MRYLPLLSLNVHHAGYEGGLCSDVVLEPLPDTQRMLARQRLLLRLRPTGLELHVPVGADQQPLLPWDARMTLDFMLRARIATVMQRTELGASPVLYGLPAEVATGSKPQDLVPLTSAPAPAATRDVLVHVHLAGLQQAWLAAPPVFRLVLNALRLPWVYYAITRRSDGLEPTIPDPPAARGSAALRFKAQPLNSTSAAGDAVGRMLLARHAGARCWRLVSGRPIPVGGVGVPPLALQVGTETVIAHLPPPPVHQLGNATLAATRRGPAQAFVYGVVRC